MSTRNQELQVDGQWKDKAERMRQIYVKLKVIRFKYFQNVSKNLSLKIQFLSSWWH